MPQIFKNFELKSASGLSILFLIEWLMGDATNLIGSVLTGQASWQVVLAGYYVSVDIIILSQYVWYTYLRPRRIIRLEESKSNHPNRDSDDSVERLDGISALHESHISDSNPGAATKDGMRESEGSMNAKFDSGHSHQSSLEFSAQEKAAVEVHDHGRATVHRSHFAHLPSKNTVLLTSALRAVAAEALPLFALKSSQSAESQAPDTLMIIGELTSWICACCYLGSRIPQIYKNQQRRSTAGLSPALFISAFCGNFFYSSSLFANPLAWSSYPPHGYHGWAGEEGSDRATWLRLAAPFFLGAFGVLALDAIIGVQFLQFGEGDEGAKVAAVAHDDGRGRRQRKWQKVTGWMRGWIPSPERRLKGSSSEETNDEQTQRLLNGESTTGGHYGAT